MKRTRDDGPLDHAKACVAKQRLQSRRGEIVEVRANQPGPLFAPRPRVEPAQVHRGQDEDAFVVEERLEPPQCVEWVDDVLEHVQEHDGVRARVGLVQLLQRLLLQVDVKALPTFLDRPPRGLDAACAPAGCAGRVEKQAHIRPDLEQAVAGDEIAAHDAQDPAEELASPLLLCEVGLVDHVRVALEDLLAAERRSRADHSAPCTLEDVVVLCERVARAAKLAWG